MLFFQAQQGKKKYTVYTTTVGPLFSRSVARPRGHRAKKAMVYTNFLGNKGKGIHHRSGKRGIHHRASDPEKEKRRVCTVVVYIFLPCAAKQGKTELLRRRQTS